MRLAGAAALQSTANASAQNPANEPHWYVISARILLITFLMTLLSFAMSLLLGIVGIVIKARLRGLHPDMAIAYDHIAFPVGVVAGAAAFIWPA